jgi:DNA-directed RNA polymerase subunit RPC12/RpoP
MVKCPYCAGEGAFKELKEWKFRFYDVKRLQCLKCNGIFNHYSGFTKWGVKKKGEVMVCEKCGSIVYVF